MIKLGNNDISLKLGNDTVDAVYLGNTLVYSGGSTPTHDYSQDYLTFTALESGTFKFTNSVEYSLDNGSTWATLAANTDSPPVFAGDKIMWKATLTPNGSTGIGTFGSTGQFDAEGNAMSLLYGDNFIGEDDLTGKDYAFYTLFNANANVVSAENLSLPATTLASNCYQQMFSGCTSLTTAPVLPATTLGQRCYQNMFKGCTSLITAPSILPSTTLTSNCYYGMFNGCTSLTTAPQLPATTLASNCYYYMFSGCTSLTTAPVLSATTLASNCYQFMFANCTSLTTAPELPATTLGQRCYQQMFRDCTNLNYIKCLATDISANNCTTNWVNGVAANGTFVKDANMAGWSTGNNGIPANWTVVDNV